MIQTNNLLPRPAPAPHSLGDRVCLVTTLPIGLSCNGGSLQIPLCTVVHRRNLESHHEHHQGGKRPHRSATVRIEVPAEAAVEGVSIPVLELRVDLWVALVLAILPDRCPKLDANGVRGQREGHCAAQGSRDWVSGRFTWWAP